MDKIIKLLFNQWNITKPKLIISVTGGAKISLKPRLKETFSKGLVKAATTTNAIIITGGSYNGCMKLVGEAFKNNALSIDCDKRISLLGIANWGTVTNNEKLVNKSEVSILNLLMFISSTIHVFHQFTIIKSIRITVIYCFGNFTSVQIN